MVETREIAQQVGLDDAGQLILTDLLNDAATLAQLMVAEIHRRSWLDAFLLAVGVNQVAEDWLHRDILSSRKVAGLLAGAGAAGRVSADLVLQFRGAALWVRQRLPSNLQAARWQQELAQLVDRLARAAAGTEPAGEWLVQHAERVVQRLDQLPPGLRASILRLPSCFRSLDQRPEDCAELARLFAERWPDRDQALLVIGLRTSGSYLAPLQAAYLRRLGYAVCHRTLRPGQDLVGDEGSILTAAGRDGSLVLICDDPPDSGAALAQAGAQLENAGIERRNIVLLVPLAGGLPARLRHLHVVELAPERWRIRQLLEPDAVRTALGAGSIQQVQLGVSHDLKTDPGRRSHTRAVYRATWQDGSEQLVYAKGVGLGYFGRHTLAVSRAMPEYLPQILGLVDGVLFREWLPEEARLAAPDAAASGVAERITSYVADRAERLPAVADRSLALTGRHPLWQRVADRLGQGFRGLRPLVRPALHRFSQRVLAASHPSVVDGSLTLSQWFSHPATGNWCKVDYDERAFSNEDLHVYDSVWDLAVAAADAEMEGASPLANKLRTGFELRTGRAVEDVRWLLHRVQYLAGLAEGLAEVVLRGGDDQAEALALRCRALEAAEAALLEHQAGLLLGDLSEPGVGGLCAIDVDGVLETSWLGISSITPRGVLALRGLRSHGYRPVLVSGRSLAELTVRCRDLGLVGAVAEYGAVAYRERDGACVELLGSSQRQLLEPVRKRLLRHPGVFLDSRWERTVRAYRLDAGGNRRGLQQAEIDEVLADTGPELRAEHGWAQTDFVPASIDKAGGTRALFELIAPELAGRSYPLTLAVGDTGPDLPVMELAERRWAPANASPALRARGVRIAHGRFQNGLAEAVTDLIGHRPGSCPVCRLPQLPRDEQLLIQALAAQDAGPWERLLIGLRLYREAGR